MKHHLKPGKVFLIFIEGWENDKKFVYSYKIKNEMVIAFSGTHSTGKTTLLDSLKDDNDFKYDYTFIDEITRRMSKRGLSINEDGDDVVQLLIMNAHLKNALNDNAIMDRCVLDGVVYTHWLAKEGKVSEWVLDYAQNVFQLVVTKYDYIFFLVPEFDIVADGVRSTDVRFRDEVADLFYYYIERYNVPVIRLTGSVQNRLQQFKKAIYGRD